MRYVPSKFNANFIPAILTIVICLALPWPAAAQQPATLTGIVSDPLGGRVASATVTLLHDGQPAGETTTGAGGEFTFQGVAEGRYQVRADAPGFETRTTDPIFVSGSGRTSLDIVLPVGPLQQAVVVTAAAMELPESRTGAPITVIDRRTLEALKKPDVLEALRLVPGAQIVQTGQRGGTTSMFIRGGNSNFNKILIDGIPANDIGGGFDFAQIATTGIDRVEVMRQSNSVTYGADALSGVVDVTTERGRTRVPLLDFAIDGGSFNTVHSTLSVGGAARRIDYFSDYSRFNTDNSTPNNGYRNGTYAGRVGVAVGHGTDVSGTLRRVDARYGSPNAFDSYGIADDSFQKTTLNYASVSAESQMSTRWQSTLRFGNTDFTQNYTNPMPTGELFDPFGFGANYLGKTVTLTGAKGASVTGQGILDFGGTYPSVFRSRTRRRSLFGSTSYHAANSIDISAGGRFEREEGFSNPDAAADATRNNGGAFAEARGSIVHRTYVTAGVGVEHNEAFGNAVVPRVSVATYLRNPSSTSAAGDTKISFNAGKGIKAPSVYQQQNALFTLVQGTPSASGAPPIGPERGSNIDVGLEQGFWYGRARVRTAYYRNRFNNLLEFLSKAQLPLAGVPASVAAASGFGAYVNSQSFRAQGIETSFEAQAGRYVRMTASYTYLDAVVTKAFSATAAINPKFPGIAIGAFSPLVGQRPFRRPPNSGSVMVSVNRGPGDVTFSGYFAGKRDESTFVTDGFFGNSMLLPNRDLDPAYQKLDLSGSWIVHPRARVYMSLENILDQKYDASFGFPSLPRTIRAGVRILLGGDGNPAP